MLYPSKNESRIDNGHAPAHDSVSLLTENECRMSPGPVRNDTIKIHRTLCYFSHGCLFALHILLLLVYKFHAEHRITITTATIADVVATILTISLQAFYTVYTAALVFVTQRLALSYNFSRRQKLTSVHDISESWIGIGAALASLWDQTKIKTSMRATTAITVYLLSISALHITSSSIMQLQTFNATITVPVSTTVGWPDGYIDISFNWSSITPLIPATYQLAALSTAGISNATIYDLVSRNLGFGEAIVNTTTISASCDLVNSSILQGSHPFSGIQVETDVWLTFDDLFPEILWKDQIRIVTASGRYDTGYNDYPIGNDAIFILLSTAIDLDSSVLNPTTLLANWTYFEPGKEVEEIQTSITQIFMAGCTLSTTKSERYVNVQTNELVGAAPLPDAKQQWTPWTSHNASVLDEAIFLAVNAAGPSPTLFENTALTPILNASPSVLDAYMMSLFGLNADDQVENSHSESSSNPSFIMSRYQLENAVAQIAAEAIWMASQFGEGNGGFSRSIGETNVMQYTLQWQLNINLAPLITATLASFIAFVSAIEVTGRTDTHKPGGSHTVKSASPLELLWLAAHMPGLTTGFKDVEKPTMNNLREAGMFDVCLAGNDIKADDDFNKDRVA